MTESPPVEVTLREITELVRTFKDAGWASLDLEVHGVHLVLGRDGAPTTAPATPPTAAPAPAAPAPAAPAPAAPAPVALPAPAAAAAPAPVETPPPAAAAPPAVDVPSTALEVRSPAVGSFWVSPSPGEAPFVSVGQRVEVDQQLAIVEVMKLMSQVSSPVAGTVVQVCAANSELVEYDQVLFLIDPADG